MSLSRSLLSRLFLIALAVVTVAGYVTVARPSAYAQNFFLCPTGANNPCYTCGGSSSYNCLPAQVGYNWGSCGVGENSARRCSVCAQWTCGSPPRRTGSNCSTLSYNACQ